MTEQQRRPSPPLGRPAARLALAAAALLAALPLYAHDFWIEPDSFRPQAGGVVAVHLRVGQNFEGDLVPRADHLIARFVLITEDGETPIVGPNAGEPAGRVRPPSAGPALLVYRSLTTPIELEAVKFEAYLADEGLEAIVKMREARGESAKPGKEIYSRCAKSLLAVVPAAPGGAAASGAAAPGQAGGPGKAGAPGQAGGTGMAGAPGAGSGKAPAQRAAAKGKSHPLPLTQRPVGLTLEIVPLADPFAMKPRATLPVQILYEGKPLANVLVVAMNAEAPMNKIKARSDKSGRASLALDRPGYWLVKAVHMRPAPAASGADWESLWASLTFELPGTEADR